MNGVLLFMAILGLINQLGDPDWETREVAHITLQKMSNTHPFLLYGEKLPDPEINARCNTLLKPWRETVFKGKVESFKPKELGKWPWIDRIPMDWPDRYEIIDLLLKLAREEMAQREITESGGPDYNSYRYATQIFVESMILAGKKDGYIQDLMEKMAASELQFHKDNPNFQ